MADQLSNPGQAEQPQTSTSKGFFIIVVLMILIFVPLILALNYFKIISLKFIPSSPSMNSSKSSDERKTPAQYDPTTQREQEIRDKINEFVLEPTPQTSTESAQNTEE